MNKESCYYCGGDCTNQPEDSEHLCDGFAGDIDGLIEMYDKILVNDIKNSLEDWMTTHGEITMGSEMTEDVNRIIDETVERRMRIRQDWMLPDRC
jgi:polygalacturonase